MALPMNLEDFEKTIEPKILNRGNDYFSRGAVRNLLKISQSRWQADVAGVDDYRVEITVEDREIVDWYCTCPYDWGPICKHVVAVLYEIRRAGDGNSVQAYEKDALAPQSQEKSQVEEFLDILKIVPQKELVTFIKNFALNNDRFINEFLVHFTELSGTKKKNYYKAWIRKIVKSYSGRHGFIDYESSFPLFSQINSLLKKAEQFFDKNNIDEAIDICKSVIEEVPVIVQYMDDSAGFSSSIVDWAFSLIEKNLHQMQPSKKEMLLNYCLQEFYKKKYTDFDWQSQFLALMPYLVMNSSQEKKFFAALAETEKKVSKENNWLWTYHIVQLKMATLKYFLITERKEEARKFALDNIEFHEFRNFLIDDALEKKKSDQAKELIYGGIDAALKDDLPGIVADYKKRLLKIAQLSKNETDIRKYAEELFFKEHFDFQYYEILKSTYGKSEWNEIVEKLIDKINRIAVHGSADSILARIYIQEKYWNRLLKLLEMQSDDLHFVDEFSKHIAKNYPDELLKIYERAVTAYARKTGRNYYNEIAQVLKKMQKITGGEKVVGKLVANFKEKYPRRRAMMEILNQHFR